MNYIDALICLPLVWGAYVGFKKSLIIEVASLIALIAGIYGAMEFSYYISTWLKEYVDWSENFTQILSFILTFILIVIIVHLIARGIQRIVKMVALGLVNRIFGGVFGILKFTILLAGLLYVLNAIDQRYAFIDEKLKEESLLYKPISKIIPLIYPRIEKEIKENQSLIA